MAATADLAIKIVMQDQASAAIDGLNNKLGGMGGIMSTVAGVAAGALAAGVTAAGGALAVSVLSAADFEKSLSAIKAVSGATAPEMEALSALALQLGKDTAFSASEAAAGIEELIKGGLSIGDVMGGAAKGALDLAAAGNVSLAEAATIAANALAQFGLQGSDMGHVADLIAGAANASALDVSDFSYSLKAAGAVAATVGFSFDDLAQAIAVMGKAGITGSDAGTSLKTMMMSLQPATAKTKELFQELGLITADGANQFFTAEGRVKSMAEVAQVLQDALSGMTEAQRLATLETIFGSDAVRAGAVLAKEGAAGFNDMAAAMGKVTAEAVGAERLNNLSGAVQQLTGSLETAAITLGMSLLPLLRDLVQWATEAVNTLIPTLDQIGKSIAAAFAGEGSAEAKAALQELRETARVTAEAIDILWTQHGARIQAATSRTWEMIRLSVGTGLQDILAVIRIVANSIRGDWEAVRADLLLIDENAHARQRAQAEANSTLLLGGVDVLTQGMLTRFTESWAQLGEVWTTGTSAIQEITTAGFTAVADLIGGIMPAIQQTVMAVWDALPEDIRADLVLIATHLATQGGVWVANLTTAGSDMLNAIVTALAQMVDAVVTWASSTFLAPIQGLVGTSTQAAEGVGQGMLGAISGRLAEIVGAVGSWVGEFLAPIRGLVGEAASAAADIGQAIVNGIRNAISNGIGSIRDMAYRAAREALDAAKRALGIDSPSKVFALEVGRPIVQGLIQGVQAMAPAVDRTMGALVAPPAVPALAGATSGPATSGGDGGTVNFQFYGPVYGADDLEDVVLRALNSANRRGRF